MHLVFASRLRGVSSALLAVAVLALSGAPALAQKDDGGTTGPPGIDHYLVYVAAPNAGPFGVLLHDQFEPPTTHVADVTNFFANPVSKNNEGIIDPVLHYTWWHLTPPRPFSANLIATNQFGDQQLSLYDAEYLWNPALKNVQGPGAQGDLPAALPVANHYLCYHATGAFTPRTVTLQDQFGAYEAVVLAPEWFCTPVEKTYQGHVDPIVRPDAHQVCYRIQPITPFPGVPITFLDEFRFGQTFLSQQIWLCVPTFKHDVTGADPTTWGNLKAIYR